MLWLHELSIFHISWLLLRDCVTFYSHSWFYLIFWWIWEAPHIMSINQTLWERKQRIYEEKKLKAALRYLVIKGILTSSSNFAHSTVYQVFLALFPNQTKNSSPLIISIFYIWWMIRKRNLNLLCLIRIMSSSCFTFNSGEYYWIWNH